MPPRISVIVPTYRDWDRLGTCLDALRQQTFERSAFEVIVVNNDPGSPCPLDREIVSDISIVTEPRPGSYAARNTAISVATGDILAFTDSDCRPSPGWLKAITASLEANPRAIATGPIKIFAVPGGERMTYIHEQAFAFGMNSPARLKLCQTANLAVTRQTFDAVGLFDASLMSGGDTDWVRRARKLGHEIDFSEEIIIHHPARANYSELALKNRRRAGGRAKSAASRFRTVLWASLKPPFNRLRGVDLASLTPSEKLRLFVMVWRLRLMYAAEFARVRYFGSQPERR